MSSKGGAMKFNAGDEVVIVGLVAGAQWNSQHATIINFSDGRYLVEIKAKQKQLRVKELNLRSKQAHDHALLIKDRFVALIQAFVTKVHSKLEPQLGASTSPTSGDENALERTKTWLFELLLDEVQLQRELADHHAVLEQSGDGSIMEAVASSQAKLNETKAVLDEHLEKFCSDFLVSKKFVVTKSAANSTDEAGALNEVDKSYVDKLEDIHQQIVKHADRQRVLMDNFAISYAKDHSRDAFSSTGGINSAVTSALKELRGIKVMLNKLQGQKDSMFPLTGNVSEAGRKQIKALRAKVQTQVSLEIERVDKVIPDLEPRTPAMDRTFDTGHTKSHTRRPHSTHAQPSTPLDVSDTWNSFKRGDTVQLVVPMPDNHKLRAFEGRTARVLKHLKPDAKAAQALQEVNSVKELKEHLKALSIPFSDCVEKKHLRDRFTSSQTRYRIVFEHGGTHGGEEVDILSAYIRAPGAHELKPARTQESKEEPSEPASAAKANHAHSRSSKPTYSSTPGRPSRGHSSAAQQPATDHKKPKQTVPPESFHRSQSMPSKTRPPTGRLPGKPEFVGTEKMPDALKVHFDLPMYRGSPPATHIRLRIQGPGVHGPGITHAQLPASATAPVASANNRRFNYTFPNLRPQCDYRIEICACTGENDIHPGTPLVVKQRTEPAPARSYDHYGYKPTR